jgi:hypothetical protein
MRLGGARQEPGRLRVGAPSCRPSAIHNWVAMKCNPRCRSFSMYILTITMWSAPLPVPVSRSAVEAEPSLGTPPGTTVVRDGRPTRGGRTCHCDDALRPLCVHGTVGARPGAANRAGTPGGARHRRSRSATPTLAVRKVEPLAGVPVQPAADQGLAARALSTTAFIAGKRDAGPHARDDLTPTSRSARDLANQPPGVDWPRSESSVASFPAAGLERTSRNHRIRVQISLTSWC